MLNAQRMLREAQDLIGLSDFGADDVGDHVQRLADAINSETKLNDQGEKRFHVAAVYLLCNRLLLHKFLSENEHLRHADVGEAMMIVGFPRTGSTKLQRLIAQDGRLDHLTLLDVSLPIAFPGEQGTEIRSKLVDQMERALGQPELTAGHHLTAAEPEEELELQKNHFTARSTRDHAAIPQWVEEMKNVDRRPRFDLVRQFIVANKVQRNRHGMAWIFKNAYAGEDVDIIAETFPKTKLIFTHRDPVEHLGSITALGHKWRRFHSDKVTKEQSGAEYLDFWSDFANRTLAACKKVPSDRILHIRYRDLLGDPVKAVEQIYDFCGYDLTAQARDAIVGYDQRNRQHKHGRHDYTLEEFGLSRPKVEHAYANYLAVHGDMI